MLNFLSFSNSLEQLTVNYDVDETPLREEDFGFGPEPVYRVRVIHAVNGGEKRWRIRFTDNGIARYEDYCEPHSENHSVISSDVVFESANMGVSISQVPNL